MQFLQLSNISEEGIGVVWIVPQLNEHLDAALVHRSQRDFLKYKTIPRL